MARYHGGKDLRQLLSQSCSNSQSYYESDLEAGQVENSWSYGNSDWRDSYLYPDDTDYDRDDDDMVEGPFSHEAGTQDEACTSYQPYGYGMSDEQYPSNGDEDFGGPSVEDMYYPYSNEESYEDTMANEPLSDFAQQRYGVSPADSCRHVDIPYSRTASTICGM